MTDNLVVDEIEVVADPGDMTYFYSFTLADMRQLVVEAMEGRAETYREEAEREDLRGAASPLKIQIYRWGAEQLHELASLIRSIPDGEIRQRPAGTPNPNPFVRRILDLSAANLNLMAKVGAHEMEINDLRLKLSELERSESPCRCGGGCVPPRVETFVVGKDCAPGVVYVETPQVDLGWPEISVPYAAVVESEIPPFDGPPADVSAPTESETLLPAVGSTSVYRKPGRPRKQNSA